MLSFVIWMLVIGFIVGLIARAVVPGDDSMGLLATAVLGVIGSFVGGFLADALLVEGDQEGLRPAGIIGSIIGAIVVLLIYRWATGSSRARVRGRL